LVILDEPTSGLDPVGRRLVRDIIHDLSQQGTVFLDPHLLSDRDHLSSRSLRKFSGVVRSSYELIEGG
jgi:ABC-2 type transport system ATP-binding protein